MSIAKLARAEIRALKPYATATEVDGTIRLNANESPWTNRGDKFRRPLNRYPEVRPSRLQAALAGRYGCDIGELLVTRGTSEAIDLLIRVFCRAGKDSIVTTSPTFSMYRHYANIQGATLREIETSPDNDFLIEAGPILEACDETTRLIFLCSPNNPNGSLLADDTLEQILQQRRDNSAVVVDEAYIEFAERPSVVGLLDRYDNLIVLHTLSKAFGLAAIRVGYSLSSPALAARLHAVRPPGSISTASAALAGRALMEPAWAEANVAELTTERERMGRGLAARGFRVLPSAANFLLCEVGAAALAIEEKLMAQGLVVRCCRTGPLRDYLRFTIRRPEEGDRLLTALEEALS